MLGFRLTELDARSFTPPIHIQSINWPLPQHQIADWNEHACLKRGAKRLCPIVIGKRRKLTSQVDLQPINPASKRDSTGRDGLSAAPVPPGLKIDVADAFAAQFELRLAAFPQNPCKIVMAEVQRELRSVADTSGAHETIGHAQEIASALQLHNAVADGGAEKRAVRIEIDTLAGQRKVPLEIGPTSG